MNLVLGLLGHENSSWARMVAAENAEQPVNHGTQWKPPTEETAEDIEAQYKIMAAAFGTRRRKEPT